MTVRFWWRWWFAGEIGGWWIHVVQVEKVGTRLVTGRIMKRVCTTHVFAIGAVSGDGLVEDSAYATVACGVD